MPSTKSSPAVISSFRRVFRRPDREHALVFFRPVRISHTTGSAMERNAIDPTTQPRRYVAFSLWCIFSLLLQPNPGKAQQQEEQTENRLGNVRIAGVSVRGLAPKQARQLLLRKLEPRRK